MFDITTNLPNFKTVWNGVPNPAQFETALRQTILAVSGVTDILSLVIAESGGVLGYTAEILTVYGAGVING